MTALSVSDDFDSAGAVSAGIGVSDTGSPCTSAETSPVGALSDFVSSVGAPS